MAVSTRKRVDDKTSDANGTNAVARSSKEKVNENDGMGLPNTIPSPTESPPIIAGTNSSSNFQREGSKTKEKYKEELVVSSSELRPSDHEEGMKKLSSSSCTKDSSKLPPACSPPSHTADLSRTHLFSPQRPPNKVSRS